MCLTLLKVNSVSASENRKKSSKKHNNFTKRTYIWRESDLCETPDATAYNVKFHQIFVPFTNNFEYIAKNLWNVVTFLLLNHRIKKE